jgi:hypothetical protein
MLYIANRPQWLYGALQSAFSYRLQNDILYGYLHAKPPLFVTAQNDFSLVLRLSKSLRLSALQGGFAGDVSAVKLA